jgi:TIR domain
VRAAVVYSVLGVRGRRWRRLMPGAARIFISYRRADAGWPARWLADRLAGQFGAGVVFQDVDSIRPGDDFAAALEAAVGACAVLLAVIGPQWLAGEGDAGRRLEDPQDWVRLEIEAAIRRRVRIIPVLVDGARMPSASELPPSLQSLVGRQAVTLSPASLDTRRLVSVLETALASKETGQQQTRTREPDTQESSRPALAAASRRLMSAVHDLSGLSDRDKASALAAIIRAAIAVAPERVEWLTAEAEAAARSIGDMSSRESALERIATAVAAADPYRAEAIACSIEDMSSQQRALLNVAEAVAAADPARAEVWLGRLQVDPPWRLEVAPPQIAQDRCWLEMAPPGRRGPLPSWSDAFLDCCLIAGDEPQVKVERPQRSEDVRP